MRDGRAEVSDDARITVYGRRALLDALARSRVEVLGVRIARTLRGEARHELEAACAERDVEARIVSEARVREWSGDPRHDQGVAARLALPNVGDIDAIAAAGTGDTARWLALDGIHNPQNAGMIVRSAVAAGMHGILWPRVGTPWLSGLVVKASASSVFDASIARCDALADALDTLRERGFAIYGLCGDGDTDLFAHEPAAHAVFAIGNETNGLSAPVRERLDARLRIPMAGGVESLNAAVAASLLCFHVCRSPR